MRVEHLYVHVPFCARRCVYCDFSIAVRSRVPVDEYVQGIEAEFAARHRETEFDLATLYLGGGTPSKLGGDGVARLLEIVRRRVPIRGDAEVTLEANPEDVSVGAVSAWASAGVNRVSLGVQSFNEETLQWMHRTHDANTALQAVQVLREGGLVNVSIDLIFATPSDLGRFWARDLETAVELSLPHISVYGLTVEPHTPLGRRVARRDVAEEPEELFEEQFVSAHDALTGAGLEHYEVSNYALPERHSRHNWAYWRRSPYGGIGPSAHEFDGGVRRWNVLPYALWQATVSRRIDPIAGSEVLTADEARAEEIYLQLRTQQGLLLSAAQTEHVAPWVENDWATLGSDGRLRLTASGWLRLDALANSLTLSRSH